MSRIYFHSKETEIEVRGSERAMMGVITANMTWAFLEGSAKEYGSRISPLRKVLTNDSYVTSDNYREQKFAEGLKISLLVGENPSFVIDGETESPFIVCLNTLMRVGNDPLKLFARLHGQCEIHTWVDGHNRAWLADIIKFGLSCGLYRKEMGWEGAIELLRSTDQGEVVTSYSVCDQFPNVYIADWEDDNHGDDWYDLPHEERWSMAIVKLREKHGSLELCPDNWENYYFGSGMDVFQVLESAYAFEKIENEQS